VSTIDGRAWGRAWLASAAVAASVLLLVARSEQPPRPRAADAPPTVFSEARAFPLIERLAAFGPRVPGTRAYRDASEALADELRRIPGIEVRLQEASGVHAYPFIPLTAQAYRLRNVLARIAGRSPDAILLSAHFDSTADGVGAADDLLGVAAAVEAARALAAGPTLERSVILCLDGDEEDLLGSTAFLEDERFPTVKAFVNLEGLPGGKTLILQASAPWLVDSYRRSAPRPYGTVVAQDLFESGALPADSDYHVYTLEGHLPGFNLATFHDGYALHTSRDRPSRIERGTLQDMGDKTLALARALADDPRPPKADATRVIYYDVLGTLFVSYDATRGRWLALGSLLLVLAALALAWRRRTFGLRALVVGGAVTLAASLAGVVVAVAAGLALPLVLHHPHGWFASPWLAVVTFASLAAGATLAVHARWSRGREVADCAHAIWAGSLALWSLALLLGTAMSVSATYVAQWWVLPGALGLLLAIARPGWRAAACVLAFVPGAILTVQVGSLFVGMMPYAAGEMALPVSFDPIIAALVALPTVACLSVGVIALHPARGLGRAALLCAVVGVIAFAVTARRFPYTNDRPKHMVLEHGAEDGRSFLFFGGSDFVDERIALTNFADLEPTVLPSMLFRPDVNLRRAAAAPPMPPPHVAIRSSPLDARSGRRTVRVDVETSGALALLVEIPRARLAAWSLTQKLPDPTATGTRLDQQRSASYLVRVQSPDAGWHATFEVIGAEPLPIRMMATNDLGTSPELEAARAKMPAWTEVESGVFQLLHLAL
jgi:peptidase M28-like protein